MPYFWATGLEEMIQASGPCLRRHVKDTVSCQKLRYRALRGKNHCSHWTFTAYDRKWILSAYVL